MFVDRKEAGKKLAEKLSAYRGTDAVVVALPRGGVVLGYEVARALALPLDICAVRKIGHPVSPEYAIGAIDERGTRILNEAEVSGLDPVWLEKESARQQEEATRRGRVYREGRPALVLTRKVVLLVDDGIATGFTLRLAVRSLKAAAPERIVVAVPVAPPDAIPPLKTEGAGEIIVLEPPEKYAGAVGAHYQRFEQVGDAEVISLLRSAYERSAPRTA